MRVDSGRSDGGQQGWQGRGGAIESAIPVAARCRREWSDSSTAKNSPRVGEVRLHPRSQHVKLLGSAKTQQRRSYFASARYSGPTRGYCHLSRLGFQAVGHSPRSLRHCNHRGLTRPGLCFPKRHAPVRYGRYCHHPCRADGDSQQGLVEQLCYVWTSSSQRSKTVVFATLRQLMGRGR